MAYTLDIDPVARTQIRGATLGAVALAGALAVRELVPERGEPLNADNPDGGVCQLPFGGGRGLITYLLLTDQNRVDVLVVTWVDFGELPRLRSEGSGRPV